MRTKERMPSTLQAWMCSPPPTSAPASSHPALRTLWQVRALCLLGCWRTAAACAALRWSCTQPSGTCPVGQFQPWLAAPHLSPPSPVPCCCAQACWGSQRRLTFGTGGGSARSDRQEMTRRKRAQGRRSSSTSSSRAMISRRLLLRASSRSRVRPSGSAAASGSSCSSRNRSSLRPAALAMRTMRMTR